MPEGTATENISELTERAREQTLSLITLAQKRLGKRLPAPEIRFDLRGTSAGQMRSAARGQFQIRYNLVLLQRHPREFLEQTVPHETAHLVTYHIHGNRVRAHGPEWAAIMALFGAEARRCHHFDSEDLRTRTLRRFSYVCRCGPVELTSIRHNRILNGQVYHCRRCGDALTRAPEDV